MENFDLKKFLTENKLTKDSKIGKRKLVKESKAGVQLSDEAREMIEDALQQATPEDLALGTDNFIDLIVEALEVIDGLDVPQGFATSRMEAQLEKISTMFHSGQLPLDQAVSQIVTVAMNPRNYSNS